MPTSHPIGYHLREASKADLEAILRIYNDAVVGSTATYDLEPVSLASRTDWFKARQAAGFPVLVAEDTRGDVVGYATYGTFRALAGYAYTVEHSIYLREDHRGKGLGEWLLKALIIKARAAGLHVMLGGIDGENKGSLRFHERLGFREVARMPEVGRKFDSWRELVFMQLILKEARCNEINEVKTC